MEADTTAPASTTLYVLVWREENSRRLRTYTDAAGSPIASPMRNIFPTPETVIDSADDLNAWLNSPPDETTVAVAEDLARSDLGWEPRASTLDTDQ